MREASKTQAIRPPDFEHRYLQGRVIDIGAGDDVVCSWAEGFDLVHGDANFITRFRESGAYDAIHSSHCLEHMNDAFSALSEWWQLLRPGGHLIVVIPEESLYEQGHWPSLFNGDHKWSFRIGRNGCGPRSIEVHSLFSALPNIEIESIILQCNGYDACLQDDGSRKRLPVPLTHLLIFLNRFGRIGDWLRSTLFYVFFRAGFAIDQTLGEALAQIQVVARKR